jgi:hypothetical protein
MRGHPEDARVQWYGCRTLGGMAAEHPANQAAAGEAGALGLVAAALQGHPADMLVQLNGCRALWCLAENHPANAAAARGAGCVQLIMSAMRAYPGNVELVGRRALQVLEPGHALLA